MEVLSKELILLDVEVASKEEAIDKLATLLFEQGRLNDKEEYKKAVYKREEEFTTGFEKGVAIPHGKSNSVEVSSVAFARLKTPVDWEALDGGLTSIIFMLAIKEVDACEGHIRLLSEIAVKLLENEFIDSLKNAKTVDDVYLIIGNIGK